jgi:hypothetical protein
MQENKINQEVVDKAEKLNKALASTHGWTHPFNTPNTFRNLQSN